MPRNRGPRGRPAVQITLARASRLHRLLGLLAGPGRSRDVVLRDLAIGLRTFNRELELLRKCAIVVQSHGKIYNLDGTPQDAEGRLPFPDPQLTFAEMAELARGDTPAARRMQQLLESVTTHPEAAPRPRRKRSPRS